MKNKTTEKIKEEFYKTMVGAVMSDIKEATKITNPNYDKVWNFIEHSINQAVEEEIKEILENLLTDTDRNLK